MNIFETPVIACLLGLAVASSGCTSQTSSATRPATPETSRETPAPNHEDTEAPKARKNPKFALGSKVVTLGKVEAVLTPLGQLQMGDQVLQLQDSYSWDPHDTTDFRSDKSVQLFAFSPTITAAYLKIIPNAKYMENRPYAGGVAALHTVALFESGKLTKAFELFELEASTKFDFPGDGTARYIEDFDITCGAVDTGKTVMQVWIVLKKNVEGMLAVSGKQETSWGASCSYDSQR